MTASVDPSSNGSFLRRSASSTVRSMSPPTPRTRASTGSCRGRCCGRSPSTRCARSSRCRARLRIPMTFRAAGTSLSGQAISDGLLVDVGHGWRGSSRSTAGERVRVQPGAIGGKVNRTLAAVRRAHRPGPGVDRRLHDGRHPVEQLERDVLRRRAEQLSHARLAGLRAAVGHGGRHVTAGRRGRLRARRAGARRRPARARDDVRRQPALVERIRKKYRIKNTIGYSLNAFLDFDSPLEMLRHLLIGSEGTLAFLAEGVLHTVPDLPVKYTGLLFFRHIEAAAEAVVPLTRRRRRGDRADRPGRAALGRRRCRAFPRCSRRSAPDAAGILVEFQSPAGTTARFAARRGRRGVARRWRWSRRPSSPAIRCSRRGCGRCARACSPPSARSGSAARA